MRGPQMARPRRARSDDLADEITTFALLAASMAPVHAAVERGSSRVRRNRQVGVGSVGAAQLIRSDRELRRFGAPVVRDQPAYVAESATAGSTGS